MGVAMILRVKSEASFFLELKLPFPNPGLRRSMNFLGFVGSGIPKSQTVQDWKFTDFVTRKIPKILKKIKFLDSIDFHKTLYSDLCEIIARAIGG